MSEQHTWCGVCCLPTSAGAKWAVKDETVCYLFLYTSTFCSSSLPYPNIPGSIERSEVSVVLFSVLLVWIGYFLRLSMDQPLARCLLLLLVFQDLNSLFLGTLLVFLSPFLTGYSRFSVSFETMSCNSPGWLQTHVLSFSVLDNKGLRSVF